MKSKLFLPATLLSFFFFLIAAVNAQPKLSPTKTIYAPAEKIIVNFSGFPGNGLDWIGIAIAGSKDADYVARNFLVGKTNGTLTFNGLLFGNYELRGYYNNDSVIKTRLTFRVGNIDTNTIVKTQKPVYKVNEAVIVEYSGLPGNSSDWLSIAKKGSRDAEFIAWNYTNGLQSGQMPFAGLPEGDYEARVYFNNEGMVRVRYYFKVQKNVTPAAPGIQQKL